MIPLKLQIKNFLSYGPKPQLIDFSPYQLICLNGKNGHGKSALLDAITWALWGQARKITGTTKPDAHLLHLGQKHMTVIFDFMFDNATYRIKREFFLDKGNSGTTVLDFGVYDTEIQKFKVLTDKSVRLTQEKIHKLLKIDFQAFINSAFLKQGNANEFSKKSPKERKQIIADILQLQEYESLRKITLEKARQEENSIQHIQTAITSLQQIQERKELLEKHYAEVLNTLNALSTQEEHHRNTHIMLQQKIAHMDLQEYSLGQLKTELNTLLINKQEKTEKLKQLFQEWLHIKRETRTLLSADILEQEKKTILNTIQQYQQKQQQLLLIQNEQLSLEKEKQTLIQEHQSQSLAQLASQEYCVNTLQQEIALIKEKLLLLNEKKKHLDTELIKQQEIYAAQEQALVTIQATLTTQKAVESLFEKRKYYYHTWVARLTHIENEIEHIENKKTFHAQDNAHCPLCEQNLSPARKRFLFNKMITTQMQLKNRMARLKKILTTLKELLIKNHQEIQIFNTEEKKGIELTNQIQNQKKYIDDITKEQANIAAEEITLQTTLAEKEASLTVESLVLQTITQEYTNALEKSESYKKITVRLTEIQTYIAEAQNQYAIESLFEQLEKINLQQKDMASLEHKKSMQIERNTRIQEVCSELKQIRKHCTQYQNRVSILENDITQKNDLINKAQETHKQLLLCLEKKEQLQQERFKVESEQNTIQEATKKIHSYQQELSNRQKEYNDFIKLAHAFSKDGIQALLIENAIPEIEQEANILLGQLTQNQAHIRIESLRDLKKGGTKETLDINISDTWGVRPYELFSGGEAFRIDFALRIAIAKLLAHRAGSSLQTLIIDEGFGSQDEEGLSLLMEGIYSIQHHFAKIIIISHLGSMKEQFPVHFMVNKTPEGTVINTIQR